jgi:hypothetical protein
MASAFSPVELNWDGKTYTIPANRVLMAIAQIEEILTMDELAKFNRRGTAPVAKLAMAYGAVLRYSGCSVSDDEVYAGMFGDAGTSAAKATQGLMHLMLPPAAMVLKGGATGKSQAAGRSSSRTSTKPRAAKSGSHLKSSGVSIPSNSGG